MSLSGQPGGAAPPRSPRRRRPLPAAPLLALLLIGGLALAACGGTAAAPGPPQAIVVGHDFLSAEADAAPGRPAVSRERAVAAAEAAVPNWRAASGVTARYVALTLRAEDGQVALGVQARPVWLVLFGGVTYDPESAALSGCPCAPAYERPDTVVAVDARDGAQVVMYGSGPGA
jgi:hypothetical protein